MPDVIEVVLQLLHRVLVALAVRIIHLRPARDTRLHQVPKMIKWNRLLVSFGALAPLRAWSNQADVSFERIPKLRQLVEPKFPQPTPNRSNTTIVFSRVNVFVRIIRAPVHRSEFEKNESSSVAADSFLSEKNRTAIFCPYEQRNKYEQRNANDQCCRRSNGIEEPFQVMIG